MEELTLTGGVITDVREKPLEKIQHMAKSESIGLWRRIFSHLRVSFNGPFQSDWEKKTRLHWRDWGKLLPGPKPKARIKSLLIF